MTPAAFDLTGRVALVTGAGSATGIGFATARLLTELGASVAVASTTERILDRAAELGPGTSGHWADLTDEGATGALVGEVVARHGALDIVVNNAGMVSQGAAAESGSALDLDLETWHASLARNLDTAFLVCRAAVPLLVDRGWGRVVNVTSVTGPVMSMRNEAAYAAAKAGMVGLTRSLAVDVAESGVTVNAVAPGWIATASQTEHERAQGTRVPMRRSAAPEEVASAIAWLCSPGAGYVTGQCVVVDGGNSVAEER